MPPFQSKRYGFTLQDGDLICHHIYVNDDKTFGDEAVFQADNQSLQNTFGTFSSVHDFAAAHYERRCPANTKQSKDVWKNIYVFRNGGWFRFTEKPNRNIASCYDDGTQFYLNPQSDGSIAYEPIQTWSKHVIPLSNGRRIRHRIGKSTWHARYDVARGKFKYNHRGEIKFATIRQFVREHHKACIVVKDPWQECEIKDGTWKRNPPTERFVDLCESGSDDDEFIVLTEGDIC